jgi:hypothetical protein
MSIQDDLFDLKARVEGTKAEEPFERIEIHIATLERDNEKAFSILNRVRDGYQALNEVIYGRKPGT